MGDLDQVPFKTIIVETDAYGKIVGSFQNDKGPVRKNDKTSELKSTRDFLWYNVNKFKPILNSLDMPFE